MAGHETLLLQRLARDVRYAKLFSEAFPEQEQPLPGTRARLEALPSECTMGQSGVVPVAEPPRAPQRLSSGKPAHLLGIVHGPGTCL